MMSFHVSLAQPICDGCFLACISDKDGTDHEQSKEKRDGGLGFHVDHLLFSETLIKDNRESKNNNHTRIGITSFFDIHNTNFPYII